RPRARKFERDAEDLAAFAADKLRGNLPRLLVAHSMGGAIGLICLRRHPQLFAAAVLSSPMVGLRTGRVPPTLFRLITRPARAAVAELHADRAARTDARPVSRTRHDPRLLALLPRPVYRRASGQNRALRLAAGFLLAVVAAAAAHAADRRVPVDPNEPPWNAI